MEAGWVCVCVCVVGGGGGGGGGGNDRALRTPLWGHHCVFKFDQVRLTTCICILLDELQTV